MVSLGQYGKPGLLKQKRKEEEVTLTITILSMSSSSSKLPPLLHVIELSCCFLAINSWHILSNLLALESESELEWKKNCMSWNHKFFYPGKRWDTVHLRQTQLKRDMMWLTWINQKLGHFAGPEVELPVLKLATPLIFGICPLWDSLWMGSLPHFGPNLMMIERGRPFFVVFDVNNPLEFAGGSPNHIMLMKRKYIDVLRNGSASLLIHISMSWAAWHHCDKSRQKEVNDDGEPHWLALLWRWGNQTTLIDPLMERDSIPSMARERDSGLCLESQWSHSNKEYARLSLYPTGVNYVRMNWFVKGQRGRERPA